MPKVTAEYRDARREQILAAAKRCFLRDGFHETSMQDLFAEAGMSAGAVYRYFPGKEDMVLAIAEENMRDIAAVIHSFVAGPPDDGLGCALAKVLELVEHKHADEEIGCMAVLVWSEALRNPELAKRFESSLAPMRADLTDLIRRHQARGGVPAGVPAESVAAMFMSMVPGYILQLAMFGSPRVRGVPDAVRALWPA